jgi:hypothetical protein
MVTLQQSIILAITIVDMATIRIRQGITPMSQEILTQQGIIHTYLEARTQQGITPLSQATRTQQGITRGRTRTLQQLSTF